VHERHELVREPGHGAGDADPADVGAAADAVHPTALGHVAVDHRAPAPDLHLALGGVVVVGEVALLVVAGPVAALVYGLAEQPGRSQLVVQLDGRGQSGGLVEQPGQVLHGVVRLDRAAGHVDYRQPAGGAELPPEVVGQAHAAGWVAGHGVDAAVGGAGPDGQHRPRPGCQLVDPLVDGDRLPGVRVVAHGGPVTVTIDLFVRDRALHHQDEGPQLTAGRPVERGHELVPDLRSQHLVVKVSPRQARNQADPY